MPEALWRKFSREKSVTNFSRNRAAAFCAAASEGEKNDGDSGFGAFRRHGQFRKTSAFLAHRDGHRLHGRGGHLSNLSGRFATATGPFGALIAWAIAGTGMYMLARVFQALAEKRPDIDAGVFAYAKAGFGGYVGSFSAFGYWLGSCLGNTFYWVLIASTLGRVLDGDGFGDGTNPTSIIVSLIGVWAFHFLILRGVKEATFINTIVTVAKIVPLIVAVLIFVFFFNYSQFSENFFGGVGMPEKDIHHLTVREVRCSSRYCVSSAWKTRQRGRSPRTLGRELGRSRLGGVAGG